MQQNVFYGQSETSVRMNRGTILQLNKEQKCGDAMSDTKFLMFSLVVKLLYLQTMETGTSSAQRGRIPLDRGACSKMASLRFLVKVLKQVVTLSIDHQKWLLNKNNTLSGCETYY